AGRATVAEEFALKDGTRLRIATAPIRLADGSSFPLHGLEPDLPMEVSLEEQRAYFADAFATLRRPGPTASSGSAPQIASTASGRPGRRPRVNEAELVRERREGQTNDAPITSGRDREIEKPLVRDPVLARALDFLKGLALVR